MDAKDMREFRLYLKQCTSSQVRGVFDKERRAGREDYAELARAEAEVRGLILDEGENEPYSLCGLSASQVKVALAL
jgi:hypothetical protein